jgi:hypothetical protein
MDVAASSWNNLWAAIGRSALPAKIAVLQTMANIFRNETDNVRAPADTGFWSKVGGVMERVMLANPLTASALMSVKLISGAMPVHVVNAGDVAHAVTAGVGDGLSRPSSGPTGSDPRIDAPVPGLVWGP